ncbi:hypothetical protein [Nitratireductor sp.]|uniref:hypothetical protein n=1 Tax=Nitratireductor sp. TaxID=1872084 RepID=UPI00261A84E4|nr:hypothetical protein [Nitratireductor sp.]MCV0381730.1 hypothetical protein [Nitratireductor sp.]
MAGKDEFEKRVQAQLKHLREKNNEVKMLHDKTIGGPGAPWPSDRFIEAHVGRPQSETELRRQAIDEVKKEQRAERQEERRREAVEQSLKRHNAQIEKRRETPEKRASQEPEKFLDRVRQQLEAIKARDDQQRQRDLDQERNR